MAVQRENQIATKIVGEGNLTPLFRAVGLRRRLFRPDVLRSPNDSQSPETLVELDYEDARADP